MIRCKYLSICYADKMTIPCEHGKELNCSCVHFINLTAQPAGRQKLYLHVGSEAVKPLRTSNEAQTILSFTARST